MRREQKNNTLTFKVNEEIELLPFLMKAMNGISRNRAKALLVNRLVLVDNIITTHALARLVPGQTVLLDRSKQKMTFRSNDLGVVYEDPYLLVIDKPGNLCVHPTGPFFRHTLWHLVGSKYGEIRFVHRLDRETSGLVIAARSRRAAAAMDNGGTPVRKEYLALVTGEFRGTVRAEGFLVHDKTSAVRKKKRFVFADSPEAAAVRLDPTAETAATDLAEVSRVPPDMTLVRAILGTGRQHQVRATLHSLGFPLAGDKLYGPDERLFLKIKSQTLTDADLKSLRFGRQALHAAVLEFRHPFTGETIRCESPFPWTDFGPTR